MVLARLIKYVTCQLVLATEFRKRQRPSKRLEGEGCGRFFGRMGLCLSALIAGGRPVLTAVRGRQHR